MRKYSLLIILGILSALIIPTITMGQIQYQNKNKNNYGSDTISE